MEVQVCKHCRRLYESVSGVNVCPNCYLALEADFKIVKQFIRSHPNASIFEVSESCKIDMEQIRQWIKDERIEYTKTSTVGIECEKCGAPIKTGRFCSLCKIDTVNTLKSAYTKKETVHTEEKDTDNAKMRFLNKNHNKSNE